MRVLGLDIATTTGWCLLDGSAETGLLKLTGERGERAGRLLAWLEGRILCDDLDIVAFEEAPFVRRVKTHVMLAGFQVIVELACERYGLPYVSVPVPTLKKFATGKGNAKKAQMVEAAARAGVPDLTPDEADAYWVARWATESVEF